MQHRRERELQSHGCHLRDSLRTVQRIRETARNAYTPGREHLSMLKNRNKASVLSEHCRDIHSGNMVDFKMSVIKRYKNDAMLRQIMESVIIESRDQGELLNTKQEWNFISLPRIGLSQMRACTEARLSDRLQGSAQKSHGDLPSLLVSCQGVYFQEMFHCLSPNPL